MRSISSGLPVPSPWQKGDLFAPERLRAENKRQPHEDIGNEAGWEGNMENAARVFALEGQRTGRRGDRRGISENGGLKGTEE